MPSAKERLLLKSQKRQALVHSTQKVDIEPGYWDHILEGFNDPEMIATLKANPLFNDFLQNIFHNFDRSKPNTIIPLNVLKKIIEIFPELLVVSHPLFGIPENHPNLNSDYKNILKEARIQYEESLKKEPVVPQKPVDEYKVISTALKLFKENDNYRSLTITFNINASFTVFKVEDKFLIETHMIGTISEKMIKIPDTSNLFEPTREIIEQIDEIDSGKQHILELIFAEGRDKQGKKTIKYFYKNKYFKEHTDFKDNSNYRTYLYAAFGSKTLKRKINKVNSEIQFICTCK